MTLQFTITPRRRASSNLRLKSATVEQLTAQLAAHKVGEKDGPALIPAIFKPCPEVCWHHRGGGFDCGGNKLHRLTENVTAMTMLAVDIDKVLEADFDALLSRLTDSGMMFWWWHTHSHEAGSGVVKARFLFPFDKHLPLKHGLQWKRWAFPALLTALDLTDVADPACKDPGRVYYLPRKPSADFPHAAGFHPGGPLNWEEMIGSVPETMPQATGPSVVPVGLPLSPRLEKAIQEAISKHGQAVAGDGGNDQAYALGALLCRDWALSHEQAMERALEWDISNDPPWQDEPRGTEQLETIIRNGSTYANGQLGSARLKLDPLGVGKALLTAFQSQADHSDDAEREFLNNVRIVVRDHFSDPLDRAKIQGDLRAALDKNSTALALPRVKLRLTDNEAPKHAHASWAASEVSRTFAFYAGADGTGRVYSVNARRECTLQVEQTNLDRAMYEYLRMRASDPVTANDVQQAIALWKVECRSLPSDPEPFAFADGPIQATTPLVFKRFDWAPTKGPHPAWDEFLTRLSDPDAFKAWVWSAFEPANRGRQYLWLWGPQGEDGKSVVLRTLYGLFGPAAAAITAASIKEPRFLNSLLWRKRFAVYADCKNAKLGMSELVRNLGGDPVTIEYKGLTSFSDQLTAKLAVASNYQPQITNENADISRCLLITVKQGSMTDDPTWEARLQTEAPTFLDACRTMYKKLCPNDGKIAISSLSQDLRNKAAREFETEYAAVFQSCFALSPKAVLTGAEFRDALIGAKLGDGQRQRDFKTWLERTHGITGKSDGKHTSYPGLALVGCSN